MSLRAALLLVLLPIAVIAQAPAPRPAPGPGTVTAPPAPAPRSNAAPDAAPAGKGIIRGVINAADTGRPIHRAEVRITGGSPPVQRSVYTDEKGRYEVTGLTSGRYGVTAVKSGYLPLAHGQVRARESGRPLELSETSPLDKIDFVLPRASVIVARVLDQFGDPVRGVVVQALIPRYVDGRRQLSNGGGSSSVTDDRGETRIHGLQPGEYYVVAAPDFQTAWRGEVETLYPGTLNQQEARAVQVGIGEEAFISLPIRRARPSTLSGTIIGSNGVPLPSPYVSLQNIRISGGGSSRKMNVAPDGTFREENLMPGDWMIVVNEPEYSSASVRLLGDDVHGLTITTRKAATVRGRVTFEGAPPPTEAVQLGVSFEGLRTLVSGAGWVRSAASVSTIPAAPDTNWTFEAQVSGAGVIRLRAGTWLLKSVLLDGKDVTDTVLDFGTAYAGKPVEVVLTQRRAQLNGSVTNDRGQPADNYAVVLFPEDEAEWTKASSRFFATARPDQQNRFTINGLPAGRYLAAAVEYLEPGEGRNPETLSRLRGNATAIELTEGASRSVTLRMAR
ncbi:MAG TPA: carboxypeptidase-like regulatory domain-containing protein [Vicinamibacterales bacterium]|nr:carboxypeptidase-like regulatory domain-containing protein [Vicinamibacterales bacterium]